MSARTAPLVRRFARNTAGRDLIVGDIHGHFTKLQAELDAAGFNPAAGDRLFSVGDLVDRGPESDHALEWLARPWFFPVAGNHEDFAIRWPEGRSSNGVWVRNMQPGHYVQNGGGWNVANPPEVSREFAEAFAALPIAMELETDAGLLGIVHADCPFDSWPDFVAALEVPGRSSVQGHIIEAAQWSRDRIDTACADEVAGVRAVVVGHTPVERHTSLGNVHFIDTMGWRGRPFTLLDAATLRAVRAGPAPVFDPRGL